MQRGGVAHGDAGVDARDARGEASLPLLPVAGILRLEQRPSVARDPPQRCGRAVQDREVRAGGRRRVVHPEELVPAPTDHVSQDQPRSVKSCDQSRAVIWCAVKTLWSLRRSKGRVGSGLDGAPELRAASGIKQQLLPLDMEEVEQGLRAVDALRRSPSLELGVLQPARWVELVSAALAQQRHESATITDGPAARSKPKTASRKRQAEA